MFVNLCWLQLSDHIIGSGVRQLIQKGIIISVNRHGIPFGLLIVTTTTGTKQNKTTMYLFYGIINCLCGADHIFVHNFSIPWVACAAFTCNHQHISYIYHLQLCQVPLKVTYLSALGSAGLNIWSKRHPTQNEYLLFIPSFTILLWHQHSFKSVSGI